MQLSSGPCEGQLNLKLFLFYVSSGLKMLPEAAGRGQQFQDQPPNNIYKFRLIGTYYTSQLVRALLLVNLAGRIILYGPLKFEAVLVVLLKVA